MKPLLIFAAAVTCVTWPLAVTLWLRHGKTAAAVTVFLLGLSLGPCLAAYAAARTARKQRARRVVLFAGGLSIIAFSVLGGANLDLEGFFMLVFTGTAGAAIGHTLVTLVVGPLLFGRVLCGWGCWRSMILELLPIGRGAGRRKGKWRYLPVVGVAATVAAGAAGHTAAVIPFVAYYAASIGLAFALKDQRAFCKYLCPNGAVLKVTSRVSLFKMGARGELCDGCGACSRICPMDIDVASFAARGLRVASGECILCQRCAHVCPKGALSLTLPAR